MSKYSTSLSFIDLLFNLLLGFLTLFILSFILINPANSSGKVDPHAEFLITLTWDENSDDDVDLWVEDPHGNIVSFTQREAGLMHLDRDDRGSSTDATEGDDGVVELAFNQEVVTIRGYLKGEYVVNAHLYTHREDNPANVSVQVLKLNPYSSVCEKQIEMDHHGQEVTICRFYVDENGTVSGKNDLPKRLFG